MSEFVHYVRSFAEIGIDDVATVGGKNASLGEMFRALTPLGVNIPNGFAVVADAYWYMLDRAGALDALQARLGLAAMPSAPLFGVVSRLVPQKGIDLVADIAERLFDLPAQLVVLGAGDADLEQRFLALAARHPGRIAVQIGFDNALAHQIEAGSDAFLMPSRFEPCGMNQMYSQRYGTLPIVRRTGGLEDTVVDCTPETLAAGTATGFVFDVAGADDLLAAVRRAATTFADVERWRKLQRNAMARDFSWDAAARRYARTYASVVPTSAPPL
jgi:starch synthase